MYNIGIDSGSRMTKLCLFDIDTHSIADTMITDSSELHERLFYDMIEEVLSKNNLTKADILNINTTGYGRKNFTLANKYSSEIMCHAKGVHYLNPDIKTIIDIGGQDTKIIKLCGKGKVQDFIMNDKCAAGTGRFLEKVADFFKIKVSDLGEIAKDSTKKLEISSTCVVFAESEIIGLVASGQKREDIINAVHHSIINRIISMSGHIQIESPVAFVGGVAKNSGMAHTLQICLNTDIYIPPSPDITGAVGASLASHQNRLSVS